MKFITLFFDTEGFWEAPYRGNFNEEDNVNRILKILDTYKAVGVFNTCGILGEMYPRMIRRIAKEGHEIASHGYRHENFIQLNKSELSNILEKTERIFEKITSQKVIGFRSPWALNNKIVYDVASQRGYKWASNKYVPFPEIFSNPSNRGNGTYRFAKMFLRFQHLFFKKEPYMTNGLLEIPLASSLEGDLLGIMNYWQESPQEWLDYAYNSLVNQFNSSGKYFNLNMHPWLIGSANRLKLLDAILNYISKHDVKFVLARDIIKLRVPVNKE